MPQQRTITGAYEYVRRAMLDDVSHMAKEFARNFESELHRHLTDASELMEPARAAFIDEILDDPGVNVATLHAWAAGWTPGTVYIRNPDGALRVPPTLCYKSQCGRWAMLYTGSVTHIPSGCLVGGFHPDVYAKASAALGEISQEERTILPDGSCKAGWQIVDALEEAAKECADTEDGEGDEGDGDIGRGPKENA